MFAKIIIKKFIPLKFEFLGQKYFELKSPTLDKRANRAQYKNKKAKACNTIKYIARAFERAVTLPSRAKSTRKKAVQKTDSIIAVEKRGNFSLVCNFSK